MKELQPRRDAIQLGVVLLILSVCAITLIQFTDFTNPLSLSDSIQIVILLVLVMVTYWYAQSTKHMSRTANENFEVTSKSHDLAVEAEKNSVLPVIMLTPLVTSTDQIRISYQNIGMGPALDFRVWIKADDDWLFGYLSSDASKNRWHQSAVGKNQDGQCEWNKEKRVLPTRAEGFNIVTEYNDIFGRCLESVLVINPHDQKFHFGKCEEIDGRIYRTSSEMAAPTMTTSTM